LHPVIWLKASFRWKGGNRLRRARCLRKKLSPSSPSKKRSRRTKLKRGNCGCTGTEKKKMCYEFEKLAEEADYTKKKRGPNTKAVMEQEGKRGGFML